MLRGVFEPRENLELWAHVEGGATATRSVAWSDRPANVSGVAVELPVTGRVRGRVRDAAGRPVEGAVVTGRTRSTTGSDGRFDVAADLGRGRVSAACAGFVEGTSDEVTVPEGDEGAAVDIRLRAGGEIMGTVVDAYGHGIDGSVVTLVDSTDPTRMTTVGTFPDGRYIYGSVSGDLLRVTVQAKGYATVVLEGVERSSGVPPIVLECERATPAPR